MVHALGRRLADSIARLLPAAGLLLAALSLTGVAGPALADGASLAHDSRYYVSTVTAVQPGVPGLDVRIGRGGWVTVSTSGDRPITVIGYAGEEYLRIGPEGAQENTAALSSAINAGSMTTLPADATATAAAARRPAHWVTRSTQPSFTWRDYRVQWTNPERPPIVAEDPHGQHEVFAWALPLRAGDTPVQVLGQVRWTGVPWMDTGQTAALVVASALIGLAVGFVVRRRRRRSRSLRRATFATPSPHKELDGAAVRTGRRGARNAG